MTCPPLPPRATDILLNTVAAVFVLDIDNYAFEFFATDLVKQILTGLPPLGVLTKETIPEGVDVDAAQAGLDDIAWQYFGGIVLGPTLIVLATVLYQGWCGDDDSGRAGLWAAGCVRVFGCFALRTQDAQEG